MTHWVRRVRRLAENFNKTFDAGGELTFSIKCRQLPKRIKMETAECQQLIWGENFYIPESFVV